MSFEWNKTREVLKASGLERKEICCDECGVSEFSEPVDECTCEDPPRSLCIPCHRKLHPVRHVSKVNWGEVDKFESREN